jgi:molecular chaperone GrpE
MSSKAKDTEKQTGNKTMKDKEKSEKMTAPKNSKPDEKSKNKKKEKNSETEILKSRIAELEDALGQKEDQLLRAQAEFDNYRKRTLKEKMELTKSAGESIFLNIIPVIDDFERALAAMGKDAENNAIVEGLQLIYKRFTGFLSQNGISEIKAIEEDFDTDLHEAVTKIPAPKKELKGKVVDVIQKGYKLNDKVIRYAKVVIGE